MTTAVKDILTKEQKAILAQIKRQHKPMMDHSPDAVVARKIAILDYCTNKPRTTEEIENKFGYNRMGSNSTMLQLREKGYGGRKLERIKGKWAYQTITIRQTQPLPLNEQPTTPSVAPVEPVVAEVAPVAGVIETASGTSKLSLKQLQETFSSYLWANDVTSEDKAALLRYIEWYRHD